MSLKTVRQEVLRMAKDGSRVPALASPWRTSASLSLTPASGPMQRSRDGYSTIQTRFFHSTPAHRLFESPDAIVAACLGVAGGILLMRFLPSSSYPKHIFHKHPDPRIGFPLHSWMSSADPKTVHDVMGIITAGFEMARKTPKGRRHEALREATFQAPYEVARLNSGTAPDFRLEEMGAVPSRSKEWEAILQPKTLHAFDITREGRVFLYFPNGESKATAAFVAVNAEISPPEWTADQRFAIHKTTEEQEYLVKAALSGWMIKYVTWQEDQPHIVDRIEKGQLPIIFIFRERASGTLYDTETDGFPSQYTAACFSSLNEPTVKKPKSS